MTQVKKHNYSQRSPPGKVDSHALDVLGQVTLAIQLLVVISSLQLQTLQVVQLLLDLMAWQQAGIK